MKRIYIVILLGIICFSCSSDDDASDQILSGELTLSKETVNLSNVEGSATIVLTSNGEWNTAVKSGADWLSVTPSSGSGNSPIRIMAKDNTDGETRQGKISVSQSLNGSVTEKEISVGQLGANPDILLSYQPTGILPFEGGDVTVSVTSNVEWEVYIDEEYDWITLAEDSRVKAFVTDECILEIAPNNDVRRTGKVIFRSTGEFVINKTVEITQEASEAYLSVEQDEFILPYRCETLSIPVDLGEYGTKYKVTVSQGWAQWDEEASTPTEIVLKLEDNDQSDFPRDAEVTVTNVNLTETISLFQYGKPNPRIGDDLTASVLAFPGAEGGGRFTTGGRGGLVYHVTNLDDYGRGEASIPGSLRYGLDQTVPRVIVFDVSGTIELKRKLGIVQPNVSILGQTAPGDGITLKNYQLEIGSDIDNIIVRFIRCRTGDEKSDHEDDGISGRWFKQAIIDHVSSSWCVDECVSFYGVKDFTVQWSIGSESLNESQHEKGAHGYGGIWSGANASFHHMLLAHHGSRMPRIADLGAGGPTNPIDNHGFFDVRNNVYYNWSGDGQGAYGGANATFNVVNSYYKAGPATTSKTARILSSDPTARIFAEGNMATANHPATFNDNWNNGIWNEFFHTLNPTDAEKAAMVVNDPFPFDMTTTHTAEDAYLRVADYAGASLRRDAIDKRIINELQTGTATYRGSISTNPKPGIIDKVSDTEGYPQLKSLPAYADTDNDGIPDVWEDAYGLDKDNPNDAAQYTLDNQGRYSNLEVYFHNLVQHIVYYQNLGGVLKDKK